MSVHANAMCLSLGLLVIFSLPQQADADFFDESQHETHSLEPQGSDVFYVSYGAWKTGIVGIRGDKESDLDLFVYDAVTDELLASDIGETDLATVWFDSPGRHTVRIEVHNLGMEVNTYELVYL